MNAPGARVERAARLIVRCEARDQQTLAEIRSTIKARRDGPKVIVTKIGASHLTPRYTTARSQPQQRRRGGQQVSAFLYVLQAFAPATCVKRALGVQQLP